MLCNSQTQFLRAVGDLARYRSSSRHLHRTCYSKVSVRLAAQTLSASVARAIKNAPQSKQAEMEETAKFIDVVDKWLDCMNTRPGYGKAILQMYM